MEYKIRGGQNVIIMELSQNLCREFSGELVRIHNEIPFQSWTETELLAERDDTREFHSKWELSYVAMVGPVIVGFCLAFEREAGEPHYLDNCVYMHRMAISSAWRSMGIGVILHCHSLNAAFQRKLRRLAPSQNFTLIRGQTNATAENVRMLQFHMDAGYRVIGKKKYPDRDDWVMEMAADDFLRSKHYQFWNQAQE